MTTNQISYIIEELLEDNMDSMTKLSKCKYFTFSKMENKFCGNNNTLFRFNSTTEMVECYPCRKINENKINGSLEVVEITNGDTKEYFELIKDGDGFLYDSYTFAEIILFKLAV